MVGGGGLVAGGGSVGGDWGVLVLVMDFREVMLTSPLELAHCAPPPPPFDSSFSLNRPHWADSVIESPCPSVWIFVCLYVSKVKFFSRPPIGPQVT